MYRRHLLLLMSLGALGCVEAPPAEPTTPVFEATDAPQRARFFTRNWDGGGGDPVLLTPGSHVTQKFEGRPVILMSDTQDIVRKHASAQGKSTRTGIVFVDADIHLEAASARVSTNPPSSRRVYKVVIDKVHHAHWHPKDAAANPPKS